VDVDLSNGGVRKSTSSWSPELAATYKAISILQNSTKIRE
jgi:hypothetical protein